MQPCTWLNGSPRLNSCFPLHLNPSSAQHESLSSSSASTRAPAPTEVSGLLAPGVLCHLFFQPMPNSSVRRFAAPTGPQCGRSYRSQRPAQNSAPAHPHSKYIAFPRGGFLQVAVSEAPTAEQLQSHDPWLGASDTALAGRGGRSRFSAQWAAQPGTRFCDVLGGRWRDTATTTSLLPISVREQQE